MGRFRPTQATCGKCCISLAYFQLTGVAAARARAAQASAAAAGLKPRLPGNPGVGATIATSSLASKPVEDRNLSEVVLVYEAVLPSSQDGNMQKRHPLSHFCPAGVSRHFLDLGSPELQPKHLVRLPSLQNGLWQRNLAGTQFRLLCWAVFSPPLPFPALPLPLCAHSDSS